MEDADWCVAVFKCGSERARDALVDFYGFLDGMVGVRDMHFVIRDRVDDEVVFSFRVLLEKDQSRIVKSKIRYSLKQLVPKGNFSINPTSGSPFRKYAEWNPDERKSKTEKRSSLCSVAS